MLAEWTFATMHIGIPAASQASTSSEVPVGIGLIPSSHVGGGQLATSSIERRVTWASTMAVNWPGMPFGQPLRSLSRKISHQARSPSYSSVRYTNARHETVLQ
jgi:hypothetical protein